MQWGKGDLLKHANVRSEGRGEGPAAAGFNLIPRFGPFYGFPPLWLFVILRDQYRTATFMHCRLSPSAKSANLF